MPTPLVSIVIPCFEHGWCLRTAVESALAQGPDIEVLVQDDGSREDPRAALADLPVAFHREPVNHGPAYTRNALVRRARGEWIFPLDADDILFPGAIQSLLGGGGDVNCGDYVLVLPNGASRTVNPDPTKLNYETLIAYNSVPGPSLFSRRAWEAVGGYWENNDAAEDWDFWIRIAKSGFSFRYAPGKVFQYNIMPFGRCTRINDDFVKACEVVRAHARAWEPGDARVRPPDGILT